MFDNDSEKLHAQLDDVKLDSYTFRAMEQAAEIEGLVNDPSDVDELTKIMINDLVSEAIEKMDRECPYINEPVLVSGLIKQAYYDEIEERFDTEDIIVDRAVLISQGYAVLEFEEKGSEYPIKKVGHLFLVRQMEPRNDTPALVDYVPRLFAFAPVGQLYIEHDLDDKGNSEELQNVIPDVLDDVDDRLFNATDECDALLSLADMVFSETQDIPGSVLSALISYVNKKLRLDTALPYKVQINGLVHDDSINELGKANLIMYRHEQCNDADGLIVSPGALSLRYYPKMDQDGIVTVSDGELHWCVDVAVHGRSADDPEVLLSVPVENILTFEPVRGMMFDNNTVQ